MSSLHSYRVMFLVVPLLLVSNEVEAGGGEQVVEPRAIEAAIREAIQKKMPWDPAKTEIMAHLPSRGVRIREGELSMNVQFRHGEDFLGLTASEVKFSVNGEEERSIWVSADVRAKGTVVSARTDLRHGIQIAEDLLEVREEDLSKVPPDAIRTLEDAIGMRVSRLIKAGEVLGASSIETPPVAKRNDMVTLVVLAPSLQVTTKGVLLESGRKGQMVKVKNVSSGKTVYGKLRDSSTVEVGF